MKKLIFLLIFLLCLANVFGKENNEKRINLGIGWGGTYGFLGTNIDVNIIPNINTFIGLGTGPEAKFKPISDPEYKFMWAAGLRYHFFSADYKIRPRISIYYGINSYINLNRIYEQYDIFIGKLEEYGKGLSIGGGIKGMWGSRQQFGFDFDLYYAITTDSYLLDEYVKNNNPILNKNLFLINAGLRYAFDL